jgi:hypothetical protein
MGWERGRYYTRSKKVNGRVVREYVGTGQLAALVAQMDALERRKREVERDALRAERAEVEALDAPLEELDDLAELLARAALVAAGFHQHKRGEWRRRREVAPLIDPMPCGDRGEEVAPCPQRRHLTT